MENTIRLLIHFSVVAQLLYLSLINPANAVNSTTYTALVAPLAPSDLQSKTYDLLLAVGSNSSNKLHLRFDIESAVTTLPCGSVPPAAFDPSKSSTFRKIRCPRISRLAGVYDNCTVEDTVTLFEHETRPTYLYTHPVSVAGVDFKCLPASNNLSVAGFAVGSQLSLLLQVTKSEAASSYKLPAGQFAYCLPSFVVFGKPESYGHAFGGTFPGSGWSTQGRLRKVKNAGYELVVKNVSAAGVGSILPKSAGQLVLKLSTVEKHTKLQRSVYKSVRANLRKIIGYGERVNAVKPIEPYDTCFDGGPLIRTGGRFGVYLDLPKVDLDLGDGNVWSLLPEQWAKLIRGSFDASLVCVAFVDAGPRKPSVLGTDLQRDQIFHYDLVRSRLGILHVSPSCSAIWP